jgi:phosphoribosylanthranilate isomerase
MGVLRRKEWEHQGKDGQIMDRNRSDEVKIAAKCIRVGGLRERNVRERNGNVRVRAYDE